MLRWLYTVTKGECDRWFFTPEEVVTCPGSRQRGTHVSLRAAIFPARQWTYSSFCRSTCPLQQVNTLSNGWVHYPLPSLAAASIPAAYREKKMPVARDDGEKRKEESERERERELHKEKNDDPFPIDIMPSLLILPLVLFFLISPSPFLALFSFCSDHRYFPLTTPTVTRIIERRVATIVSFSLPRRIFRACAGKTGSSTFRPFVRVRIRNDDVWTSTSSIVTLDRGCRSIFFSPLTRGALIYHDIQLCMRIDRLCCWVPKKV